MRKGLQLATWTTVRTDGTYIRVIQRLWSFLFQQLLTDDIVVMDVSINVKTCFSEDLACERNRACILHEAAVDTRAYTDSNVLHKVTASRNLRYIEVYTFQHLE